MSESTSKKSQKIVQRKPATSSSTTSTQKPTKKTKPPPPSAGTKRKAPPKSAKSAKSPLKSKAKTKTPKLDARVVGLPTDDDVEFDDDDIVSVSDSDDDRTSAVPAAVHAGRSRRAVATAADTTFTDNADIVPIPLGLDSKTEASLKTRLAGRGNAVPDDRGVLYIGHLPYGFHEKQMKQFFEQFGTVTRLRLSRNRQGKSRHYAFVEFEDLEVAKIVGETMDNYVLLGNVLSCSIIPNDRVHNRTFVGHQRRFYVPARRKLKATQAFNAHVKRTPEKDCAHVDKLLRKERAKRRKLEAAGIKYDFPGFEACVPKRPRQIEYDDA
eukprot:gnl/Spiro4/27077_TR13468_c1_g1_i1.p1 gnl/Spiro4/27077_TR13468_c1_g1~~gnl/Spiro4/27077_TR13468_c1_g1_i1.p1  ORF type:complete len:325 (+),score=89.14 gnl/Spiro4/27077_TR13468_c1_g1_i1:98-1072(+)